MLKGKKILLGISGSIAAYKMPHLVRLLKKEGAEVQVICTTSATKLVCTVALSTVSQNPVYSKFYKNETGEWTNHVQLGMWADLLLIAPASANTIAKMANGHADNLLLTTYFSAKCPVYFAPAMDLDMMQHATTKRNINTLQKDGCILIPPADGELASGLIGEGRMEEPENIVKSISTAFKKKRFKDLRILVNAGPTYENIDPVRFIGNYSSGKTGIYIAEKLAEEGANVILVCGPSVLQLSNNHNITRIDVTSAKEMYACCTDNFASCNAAILSAAVADYAPVSVASEKIKKNTDNLTLELRKNPDILKKLGQIKKNGQVLGGFALESHNAIANAKNKLTTKNLDFIVLNSLQDKGAGFHHDTNKIHIFDKNNKDYNFKLKTKREVAADVVNHLANYFI